MDGCLPTWLVVLHICYLEDERCTSLSSAEAGKFGQMDDAINGYSMCEAGDCRRRNISS